MVIMHALENRARIESARLGHGDGKLNLDAFVRRTSIVGVWVNSHGSNGPPLFSSGLTPVSLIETLSLLLAGIYQLLCRLALLMLRFN